MLLLIDNFDSFSHILADLIRQTGVGLEIVRNDVEMEELQSRDYDGIILSPGPETPSKAGNLLSILEYYHDKLPILGVCLGHQAIGQFFGARLEKAIRPMHGKISEVYQKTNHPLLDNLPYSFAVTRYHSLILKDLPQILQVLLATEEGEVMAISHRFLPITGIQFHPEAHLTESGLQLITNWVASVGNSIALDTAS